MPMISAAMRRRHWHWRLDQWEEMPAGQRPELEIEDLRAEIRGWPS